MKTGISNHQNPFRSAASRRHRSARKTAAMRGASLVEIMVVLVILLIGVFLVIRIFPTGFATLRSSSNRTSATRLAERLLSLAKGDASGNLPEAVLYAYRDTTAGSPTEGQLVVDTTQDPDSLSAYIDPNDATRTPNRYFSDVNRFHYIKGEQVKIPLPTTALASGGLGSVYAVQFGPIYMDPATVGLAKNAPNASTVNLYNSYLTVAGGPMTPIPTESNVTNSSPPYGSAGAGGGDASGNLRGPQSFLVDFGDDDTTAYIMFPPRAPATPARTDPSRYFTVTYSYLSNGSATGGVQTRTVTIQVPDDATPQWLTIPTSNGDNTPVKDLVVGSVTASRLFQRIKGGLGGDAWDTTDPYQYKLAADNVSNGGGIYTFGNVGAILFNPAGANYIESTPYGSRPFTAYVDYAVLNWHILHDDIQVPTISLTVNGFVPVRTVVSPIKQVGDTETDASGGPVPYNNIFNDPNFAFDTDILVYDLSDPGAGPLTIGNYRNPGSGNQILTDEDPRGGTYRTGTIYINQNSSYFNPSDPNSPQMIKPGATLRVMYQADGDWAVALQKAATQYTCPLGSDGVPLKIPADDTVSRLPAYNSFGENGLGANAKVYFPPSDQNKSVSLSIEYQVKTDDSTTGHKAGQWVRLAPVQITLDKSDKPQPNSYGTSVKYAVAWLNNPVEDTPCIPVANRNEFDNATQWRVAVSNGVGVAYGTSVKARVIWHDSDTSSQRWRVQDLDSNLTPSP